MDIEVLVLYEDNHLLAVNKPAGLLVQGDQTGDACLIDHAKQYLKVKYKKPGNVFVGLVHRLDRPVSGVVLLAKTSKALTRMNQLFSQHRLEKRYWALTAQRPVKESGHLVHWLKKDPAKNRTAVYKKEKSGTKKSELEYNLVMSKGKKNLLEVNPKTGRPHQIRAQLSAIGCPILGDVKYGSKVPASNSIALHAKSLKFIHPVKKEPLNIEAPLPENELWII